MHSNRVLRFNPFWNVRLFSTNLLFFGSFSKGITAGSSWSKDAKARLNSISVHEEAFSELNDLFKAVRKVGGSSGWSIMIAINFWKFFYRCMLGVNVKTYPFIWILKARHWLTWLVAVYKVCKLNKCIDVIQMKIKVYQLYMDQM